MPRELTSFESVTASPTAEPLVQRTIRGSRLSNRRAERRSVTDMAILLVVSGGRTRTGTPLVGQRARERSLRVCPFPPPRAVVRRANRVPIRFGPPFSYSLEFSALPVAA